MKKKGQVKYVLGFTAAYPEKYTWAYQNWAQKGIHFYSEEKNGGESSELCR